MACYQWIPHAHIGYARYVRPEINLEELTYVTIPGVQIAIPRWLQPCRVWDLVQTIYFEGPGAAGLWELGRKPMIRGRHGVARGLGPLPSDRIVNEPRRPGFLVAGGERRPWLP